MQLWYLGTPYSDPDYLVRGCRYKLVCQVAGAIMKSRKDVTVYSPISHCHPIADFTHEMPTDFEFWSGHNIRMLRACDAMVILAIKGYEESKGLIVEKKMALAMGLDVFATTPEKWGCSTPKLLR